MKKLLFMLLASASLIACEKDNGGDNTPPPSTNNNQTIYADQTEKRDAISFTAPQAWTAVVSDVTTRATNGDVEWLQLSAYSGSAGKQSLSISLMPNFTGQSRKVEIVITSGETVITIIVEQKAKTEDNKAPQYKTVKRINSFKNGESTGYLEFSYDNQQRVINVQNHSLSQSGNWSYKIAYSESQIIFTSNEETTYVCTYDLDKHGKVISEDIADEQQLPRANYTYNSKGYLIRYPYGVMKYANGGQGTPPNRSNETTRRVYAENTWDGANITTTIIDKGEQYPRIAKYEYTDKLNNGLTLIDVTAGYKGQAFMLFKDGSFGPRNKNLIKRETGSFTRDWSYEFDKDGNMTKFSMSNDEEGHKWREDYEIIYN